MIVVLTPCFAHPSRMTYLTKNIRGLINLKPYVLSLELGNEISDVPAKEIQSKSIAGRVLTSVMSISYNFWHNSVMNRPYRWLAHDVFAKYNFSRFCTNNDVHLILVHFEGLGVSFLTELEKTEKPLVIVCHTSELYPVTGHKPYARLLYRLFKRADKVLCVSKYLKDRVVESGCPEGKIDVFYLGVEVPTESKIPRGSNSIRFVTTGRLTPVKGHKLLIQAFSQVIRDIPKSELIIIGDGPLRRELESLTNELGLSEAVRFTGAMDWPSIKRALFDADVYVQASQNEALGLSILEGMSTYLPVVATNVGGVAEIVQDHRTGFLASRTDVRMFADLMKLLARDSDLRSMMGQEGRHLVEKMFDKDKQNKRLTEMLTNLTEFHKRQKA